MSQVWMENAVNQMKVEPELGYCVACGKNTKWTLCACHHCRKDPIGTCMECRRESLGGVPRIQENGEPKKMMEFPKEHHEAFSAGYLHGQRSIFLTMVKDAREALKQLVETGDPHENVNCPQDDTCECKLAARINEILGDLEKSRRCAL